MLASIVPNSFALDEPWQVDPMEINEINSVLLSRVVT